MDLDENTLELNLEDHGLKLLILVVTIIIISTSININKEVHHHGNDNIVSCLTII